MTLARAYWLLAPEVGALLEEELPPPDPAYRLLRATASGVSRGTESLVFHGRVPTSQYDAMRAPLMAGVFPFPVKYGYALVGQDASGGRWFCLHPHQDLVMAPVPMCVPIPDAVPDHRATLAANMETALNITWDAGPLIGQRIMVIGAGVVGLLTASLLARLPATCVTLVDVNPGRAGLARRFGCEFATPDDAPDQQELIIHASATEPGLRLALASAAPEALIIEASWYGDAAPAVPLGEDFHARRLRIVASQVGSVAPAMRAHRTHGQRLALALGLLADPAYDALLDGPTSFTDLPAAMPAILRPGGLCHVITYGTP